MFRCDSMLNCKDGSDEQDCHRVLPNIGYNKLLNPPPLPGDEYFYINVSLDYREILYIDEEEGFVRITHSLQKDWYDSLLTYQNLKKHQPNLISEADKNLIWTPWVTFKNIENKDKTKRTDEPEVFKVVPNKNFHYKHNTKTDNFNAFLFEVLPYKLYY